MERLGKQNTASSVFWQMLHIMKKISPEHRAHSWQTYSTITALLSKNYQDAKSFTSRRDQSITAPVLKFKFHIFSATKHSLDERKVWSKVLQTIDIPHIMREAKQFETILLFCWCLSQFWPHKRHIHVKHILADDRTCIPDYIVFDPSSFFVTKLNSVTWCKRKNDVSYKSLARVT